MKPPSTIAGLHYAAVKAAQLYEAATPGTRTKEAKRLAWEKAEKKFSDAIMTANQFQSAIDRIGLSQLGVARLVGSDGRTARRWALGERSVPEAVAIILRLMIDGKITPADIVKTNPKQLSE